MFSMAFKGLFIREYKRFMKVPFQTIGTPVISTFLYLMIFGVSLGDSIHLKGGIHYLAFLIPGLITMNLIRNAYENSSSAIVAAKYMNELQDLRVTPLSLPNISLAKNLASLLRGFIVALITYLVGAAFYYLNFHEIYSIKHPLWLVVFFFVGGITFSSLGIFVAMFSRSFEQISAIGTFVLLPLIYLGGVFFNMDTLDPFWHAFSLCNPLFYLINGIRFAIIGASDINPMIALGVCLAFMVLFLLICHVSLKKGAHYSRMS